MSWDPVNLALLGERESVKPTIAGLVYPGRRHVFSGPPEAAKTWAALAIALEEVRAGGRVAFVDFETFEYETRDRLRALGMTSDEFERFSYFNPETPAQGSVIPDLIEYTKPTLVVLDAAAGLYNLQGLDDNKRDEVERFAQTIIEPFRREGIATILLDHVVKSAEARGQYAIGSERKIGGADVHLGFEAVVPFGRGRAGLIRITTHKDRLGWLPRPRAAELELRSDFDTHAVTWEFKPATETEHGAKSPFRPTTLMDRVLEFMAGQTEPVTRKHVRENVRGNAQWVGRAIDQLVAEHKLHEAPGPRGAKLLTTVDLFRQLPAEDAEYAAA